MSAFIRACMALGFWVQCSAGVVSTLIHAYLALGFMAVFATLEAGADAPRRWCHVVRGWPHAAFWGPR